MFSKHNFKLVRNELFLEKSKKVRLSDKFWLLYTMK